MKKITPQKLAKQLRNIGPTMAAKLIKAKIDTPEKLRKAGAKKSYLQIHKAGGFCGKFNALYLFALEGAIRDCDWLAIPETKKKEYKELTKELRKTNEKIQR